MVPLSPPLLISAASVLVGAGAESETRRGRLLDLILRRVGQPTDTSWSAALVHHVGYWSHYDFVSGYSSWPLPATTDPQELEAFGRERGIFADEPERGDVFLQWSPARRHHARAGIIVEVQELVKYPDSGRAYWVCSTIEGETTDYGAPGGDGIHLVQRQLSTARRDRFLRWTALDPRSAAADPAARVRREGGRLVIRRAA